MEYKFSQKTSLFDQISFLMVGSIATIIIVFNLAYLFTWPLPVIDLGSALVWLTIAYFAGHVIHTISNVIRDIPFLPLLKWETRPHYMPHEELLLEDARNYFKQNRQNERHDFLWNLCYMFAMGKDGANQVETFSAYYNLYRGWFTTLLLESIFLGFLLYLGYTPIRMTLFILTIIGTVLFYRRSKRFWQYLNDKVFGVFTIFKSEQQ